MTSEPARTTRRRGAALETAILEAAWDQLLAEGYAGFTTDAVAARAGTSKPVLYRRWPSRIDLLQAAVRHRGVSERVPPLPDTGNLRGDLLAALRRVNTRNPDLAALLSANLASYFTETGQSPADVRRQFLGERARSTDQIIARAVERGEVDPARVTPRRASLAIDLWRHEFLMTLEQVPDAVLVEIVDDLALPLLVGGPPPAAPRAGTGPPQRPDPGLSVAG